MTPADADPASPAPDGAPASPATDGDPASLAPAPRRLTGGCTCGAVAYTAVDPVWTVFCHCGDCRRATGAPLTLWVGFPAQRVEMTGAVAWRVGRNASVARAFCGICGSPIAYRDTKIVDDELYIAGGSLDAPAAAVPQGHAYWHERLPFVAIVDDLPKFDTMSRSRGAPA